MMPFRAALLASTVAAGGGGGPTTDVVLAVQDFASGSATGNLDVTSATISGVTPKAAIFIGTNQSAGSSTETADAIFSLGWGTDTQGPGVIGCRSRDNQASTSCSNSSATTSGARFIISPSAASLVENANSSMIAGGNRFNFSTNDATDRRGVNLYFAGADVSAFKNEPAPGASASDQNTVGFQPDVVCFMHNADNGSGFNSIFRFSFGICVRDNNGGGTVQRGLMFVEDTSQAAGSAFSVISTSYVGGTQGLGGPVYAYSCGSFDSQGFTITPTANMGTDVVFYLALKLTGRKVKLVDLTTPTSTGNSSITGVGFEPQCAIVVLTNLEAVDDYPAASSDNQSGFSISFIGDEQWASAVRMDSGADPTDTASTTQNVALLGPSSTSCEAIKAALTSFDADGMTLNYSAVQGTGKKGFILFIE